MSYACTEEEKHVVLEDVVEAGTPARILDVLVIWNRALAHPRRVSKRAVLRENREIE